MKNKIFLRTLYITLVMIFCLGIGLFGSTKAYEGIRKIGFGENRKAIAIEEERIKFFDIEIKYKI